MKGAPDVAPDDVPPLEAVHLWTTSTAVSNFSFPPLSRSETMTLHENFSKVSLAPSYQTFDPASTSPASAPGSYRVGSLDQVNFVTFGELHRHLRLLGAFTALRRRVETAPYHGVDDPRAKWTIFAHFAAYRYETYIKEVVAAGSGTVTLPPLDVAMIFHTHLLNPT